MFSNIQNLFTKRRNKEVQSNKAAANTTTRTTTPPATKTATMPGRNTAATRQPTQFELERRRHMTMKDDGLRAIPNYPDIHRLIDILCLNRCDDAPGIATLLRRYFPSDRGFEADAYGNRFLTIRTADGWKPRVMFTSHFDTMSTDKTREYHPLCYNKEHDVLFRTDGNILGADDGTGLWLMLNMIDAGVPGLYAFYMDEEVGRRGSLWSLKNQPERYIDIDAAISFDRKGTEDIVATQRGDRCCSEEFQRVLAGCLSHDRLKTAFKGGARGSFTDSATFMDDISECTNIAVGYDKQHSEQEVQLVGFAARLREVLTLRGHDLDKALPAKRDPTPAPTPAYWGGYRGSEWTGYSSAEWDGAMASASAANTMAAGYQTSAAERMAEVADALDDYYIETAVDEDDEEQVIDMLSQMDSIDLIESFPETISDILELCGWDRNDTLLYIAQTQYGLDLDKQ